MKQATQEYGFTLVELLVVIAIIGLLFSLTLSSLALARMKGRDAKRAATVHQIQTAVELYRASNNRLPGENDPQQVFTTDPSWCTEIAPYAVDPCKNFKDPLKGSYLYLPDTTNPARPAYYIGAKYESQNRPETIIIFWGGPGENQNGLFYLVGPIY